MQTEAHISKDLISIIQALVIIFIAADQIVRWLYRIKRSDSGQAVFTRGWGG
jgi:simple sugar transport system permease protein